MDDWRVLGGKMLFSTGKMSSPPQRTKQVGFVGGYVHSVPRLLHLRQCGISFPHLRFAVAQASHAFISRVVAMFVGGGFHNPWRKIDQLLGLFRLYLQVQGLAGAICFGTVTAPPMNFQIYLSAPQRHIFYIAAYFSPCIVWNFT